MRYLKTVRVPAGHHARSPGFIGRLSGVGRRSFWWCAWIGLAACFSEPGSDGEGSGGSTSETQGSGSETGSTGGGASATGDPSTSGDVADETAAGATVSLSGVVYDSVLPPRAPVVGARVALVEDPSNFVLTDGVGHFRLDGVASGVPAYLTIDPDAGAFGMIDGVEVAFDDVEAIELFRYSRALGMSELEQLQAMDPSVVSLPDTGSIVVQADRLATSISLTPMPPPGNYYAYEAGGEVMLNSTASSFVPLPAVVFFNLMPGPPGNVSVGATHPTASPCAAALPSPPIRADHISVVRVACQ
jgi:hypothetical protein